MLFKIHGAFTALILFSLGTACTESSVAEKYLAEQGSADSDGTGEPDTTDPDTTDPDTTDPDTTDPDTMDPGTGTGGTGDAAEGAKLVEKNGCPTCHNGTISMVVLDKTAVDRVAAAKDQALHAGFKDTFEGTNAEHIKAYLSTK